MSTWGPDRPGEISPGTFRFRCALCGERRDYPNYAEASIGFTAHLNERHPGWDQPDDYEEAPPEENFWDDRTMTEETP